MSVETSANHGHGLQAMLKTEVARPAIDPYHVRFALDRRPGVSWQNLAQMLRVNAIDLQRACEHPEQAAPAFAVVAAKPAKAAQPARTPAPEGGPRARHVAPHVTGGTLEHAALIAIEKGHGFPAQLAGVLRRDRNHASNLIGALRNKGFVVRGGRFEPATINAAGLAELGRLEAIADAGGGDW